MCWVWRSEKKMRKSIPGADMAPGFIFCYSRLLRKGGPDGELSASLRYLSQRYSMPYDQIKAVLTDIGVEELAHLEIVGTVVHQLTRNMSVEQVEKAGFQDYFVDHTAGIYAQAAGGWPYSAATFQVKGDVIADLAEDMGADGTTRKGQHEEIR